MGRWGGARPSAGHRADDDPFEIARRDVARAAHQQPLLLERALDEMAYVLGAVAEVPQAAGPSGVRHEAQQGRRKHVRAVGRGDPGEIRTEQFRGAQMAFGEVGYVNSNAAAAVETTAAPCGTMAWSTSYPAGR